MGCLFLFVEKGEGTGRGFRRLVHGRAEATPRPATPDTPLRPLKEWHRAGPDHPITPHRAEGMMRLPELPQELVRPTPLAVRREAPLPPARGAPEPLHAGVARAPLPPEIAKLLEWRRELVEKLRRRQPQPV